LRGYFSCHIAKGEGISTCRKLAGKAKYGNVDSGSIFYVTRMMLTGLSIIFIGILLNMVGQKEQVTGLTPAFIIMLYEAFIPRIGEIMKGMISRRLNDTTDALPKFWNLIF
jgi:hypothetical protein